MLSFTKDAAKQEANARRCLAWRRDNAAMLDSACRGVPLPKDALIKKLCLTDLHGTTELGEVVSIVRAGLCSPPALLAAVTEAEFYEWLLYQKEQSFIACDATTRARRWLVKCVTVVDLDGVSLASASSSASIKYQKIVAETSKIAEFAYPQLLGRQILLHPPRFFSALFRVVKSFMNDRVVDKLGVCPGPSASQPSASACPYASRRFQLSTLPSFLGGLCKCTSAGGCVCGTPNERTAPAQSDGEAVTVSVAARAKHLVHMPARAAGATLVWEFSVAAKGIDFSATVTPDSGQPITLAAVRKVRAEDGVVKGQAFVPIAGTVCLSFDNGHSRITSKSVRYDIAVVAATVGAAGEEEVMVMAASAGEAVVSCEPVDDASDDEA